MVEAVSKRPCKQLLCITTSTGQSIKVTHNHPFLTQKGWIKACDLNQSHCMLTTHEAMRIMSSVVYAQQKGTEVLRKLLLSEVVAPATRSFAADQAKTACDSPTLQAMQQACNSDVERILQPQLQRELVSRETRMGGSQSSQTRASSKESACRESRVAIEASQGNARTQPDGESRYSSQGECGIESDRPQAKDQERERHRTHSGGAAAPRCLSKSDQRLRYSDFSETGLWLSHPLQSGLRVPTRPSSRGVRRAFPRFSNSTSARREEGCLLEGAWVDRVEVLQQTRIAGTWSGLPENTVYNLQVSGHPSYSVNGLLVHNCHFMPMGFLDALANLESNGIVFTAMMGNLPNVHNR